MSWLSASPSGTQHPYRLISAAITLPAGPADDPAG